MKFHVLTLFPEMIENAVHTSITGRAVKKGTISLDTVNIRDFSDNKHMRVDDYPYGGGAGMVMQPEPVYRAWTSVAEPCSKEGKKPRCIYLTPQGRVLNQTLVEELAMEEELILLCGHYEGIDERVLEEVVTDYVSIGDYVLTGGELAACVLIDAVSRFVPGVLSNEESFQFESIQDNLLEYPHYTRPEVWQEGTGSAPERRPQKNPVLAYGTVFGEDQTEKTGPSGEEPASDCCCFQPYRRYQKSGRDLYRISHPESQIYRFDQKKAEKRKNKIFFQRTSDRSSTCLRRTASGYGRASFCQPSGRRNSLCYYSSLWKPAL